MPLVGTKRPPNAGFAPRSGEYLSSYAVAQNDIRYTLRLRTIVWCAVLAMVDAATVVLLFVQGHAATFSRGHAHRCLLAYSHTTRQHTFWRGRCWTFPWDAGRKPRQPIRPTISSSWAAARQG